MATSQSNATMTQSLPFTNWLELASSLVCLAYTTFSEPCLLPGSHWMATSQSYQSLLFQEILMEDWFHEGSCMFTNRYEWASDIFGSIRFHIFHLAVLWN